MEGGRKGERERKRERERDHLLNDVGVPRASTAVEVEPLAVGLHAADIGGGDGQQVPRLKVAGPPALDGGREGARCTVCENLILEIPLSWSPSAYVAG